MEASPVCQERAPGFGEKVPVYLLNPLKSFITSPARINPATEGTKAILPGAILPAVPFFSWGIGTPFSSYSLDGTGSSLE